MQVSWVVIIMQNLFKESLAGHVALCGLFEVTCDCVTVCDIIQFPEWTVSGSLRAILLN